MVDLSKRTLDHGYDLLVGDKPHEHLDHDLWKEQGMAAATNGRVGSHSVYGLAQDRQNEAQDLAAWQAEALAGRRRYMPTSSQSPS